MRAFGATPRGVVLAPAAQVRLALFVHAPTPMKKEQTKRPIDDAKPCSDDGSLLFSLETLVEHRLHKISSWKHLRSTPFLVILSSPLIYVCALPFLLLDVAVALYQLVCFPIYGIPKVRRKDYLIFDRGKLAYLNTIEKVGCIYCSYANGLLAMITEIAARSEQHFCPIKHAHTLAKAHSRYAKFLPYGDAPAYRKQSDGLARAYDDLAPGNK
jgi:hypothetical protein